jgi:hypothetical protein
VNSNCRSISEQPENEHDVGVLDIQTMGVDQGGPVSRK